MPTYEYECTRCGHRFERFQSMTDTPVKRCEQCRCKVKRLLGTGAGLIFKGSGFYLTDYRSSGYAEAAKKDKPESSPPSGDKKEAPKSESAPKTKTESPTRKKKKT